jgi:hypothetical protein
MASKTLVLRLLVMNILVSVVTMRSSEPTGDVGGHSVLSNDGIPSIVLAPMVLAPAWMLWYCATCVSYQLHA